MKAAETGNAVRAAQYLRMSSDNQRYSTQNQQNAIAEYAERHGYEVIASYIDAGKSGLSLKAEALSSNSSATLLPHPEPLMPSWCSMSAGGDGFKIRTRPRITNFCAGRPVCVSST